MTKSAKKKSEQNHEKYFQNCPNIRKNPASWVKVLADKPKGAKNVRKKFRVPN